MNPLFDPDPWTLPTTEQPVVVALSADRRRTLANRARIAAGQHPATRAPLLSGGQATCSTCAHAHHLQHHNRSWWKCDRHRLGMSHSAASDIRASWPACTLYEPHEVDQ
jgi:hypothetical protein